MTNNGLRLPSTSKTSSLTIGMTWSQKYVCTVYPITCSICWMDCMPQIISSMGKEDSSDATKHVDCLDVITLCKNVLHGSGLDPSLELCARLAFLVRNNCFIASPVANSVLSNMFIINSKDLSMTWQSTGMLLTRNLSLFTPSTKMMVSKFTSKLNGHCMLVPSHAMLDASRRFSRRIKRLMGLPPSINCLLEWLTQQSYQVLRIRFGGGFEVSIYQHTSF